jgi:Arc/MetJ-type ribon-helix-helix transcriptional regulator
MEIVRVQLPEDLKSTIDRQVAEGRAATEAEYVATALRLYADHLDAEDEIAAIVERADADIAAGRCVTLTTQADSDAPQRSPPDATRGRGITSRTPGVWPGAAL